ncbi:ly6/PLAUR domain-containing protein 1 isoform X3 [Mirounga angustirostris]|uniref:ly6/PLAUR domain-containing protein 1 isoform X3 n=1 Tax=Mirounga angustirostris TaxID=9716 RepID=UPI00313C9D0B
MWVLGIAATFCGLFLLQGFALQIQCYQCEEFQLNNDCSSPEFIVNCTVNVQDMCQKEVMEQSAGLFGPLMLTGPPEMLLRDQAGKPRSAPPRSVTSHPMRGKCHLKCPSMPPSPLRHRPSCAADPRRSRAPAGAPGQPSGWSRCVHAARVFRWEACGGAVVICTSLGGSPRA